MQYIISVLHKRTCLTIYEYLSGFVPFKCDLFGCEENTEGSTFKCNKQIRKGQIRIHVPNESYFNHKYK